MTTPWPRRKALRLPGYDYTRAGAYFVTICTRHREPLLGRVVDGETVLSAFGQIADATWRWLGEQYPYVVIDAYVVMPNHLHGILWIVDEPGDVGGRGRSRTAPTAPAAVLNPTDMGQPPPTDPEPVSDAVFSKRKPLGRLIGAFKTVSTKQINLLRNTPGAVFWQHNYYEHIVRGERKLEIIRRYILNNPARWEDDRENPKRVPRPARR